MKLKALKNIRYGGKSVKAGEPIEVKRRDLRVLQAAGLAGVWVDPPRPKPVPAVFKPIVAEVPDEVKSEEVVKPKRAYKRRDMTAEE
jgi:hypothetical protein